MQKSLYLKSLRLISISLLICATSIAFALLTKNIVSESVSLVRLSIIHASMLTIFGAVLYFISLFFKTNNKKQFELTKRYEAIISNQLDVIAIIDKDGSITYKSSNIKNIFGWEPEELLGKHAFYNVHPSDCERLKQSFNELLKIPNKIAEVECAYRCKDGTYKQINIKAINLLNTPYVNGVILYYHDISEQKNIEQILVNEENKYRTLFDNIIDVVCILDIENNIVDINDVATTLYEYSREELIGMNISQLVHPDDKSVSGKYIDKLSQEGFYERYEGRVLTKSGKTKWIQVSSKALHVNNQYAGSQDIIRDITKRKELEISLRRSARELKRLNETKDKFFSIIAHDLKAPFNSLLGLSKQLSEKFDMFSTESLRNILNQLYNSAESTYKLLVNLLEWSNTQRGKIIYSPEILSLDYIIDEQIKLFEETAKTKTITILKELKSDIKVYADKNMITSIFRNLISNAIKFTHNGGVVRIRGDKHALNTVICVQDNGVGMSNVDRRNLFKLSKARSTPGTNNESGTGLGLILCKEFIDKHHGEIWVESEPDSGSCFRFSIPHKN